MAKTSGETLDLTRDLNAVARRGTSVAEVNALLGDAVEALGPLIPFDLATVMELDGEELTVRVARGELAAPAVDRHRLSLDQFPSIRALLKDDRARAFTEHDHRDGDGDAFDGVLDLPEGHSCMVVPLRSRADVLGIMTFDRRNCGVYPPDVVDLAGVFGKLLAMALSYGEQSTSLERLVEQLREQSRLLGERVSGQVSPNALMEQCRSPAMRHLEQLARRVAAADTPVLITGETGTGKEVLAGAIHGWSPRASRPMVGINCAALPESLIESELFGHVKGAFSGATGDRLGRFQAANGGTLFLDEIGELPLDLQAKLLRVLQEGCFEPVGSDRTVRVDVRILAATNVDLVSAVDQGRFRRDLYYRLAVFPLQLPPLRDRREDIEVIAEGFLESLARRTGRDPWHLGPASRRWLTEQTWNGNVRELINALERATILSEGPELVLGGGTPRGAPEESTVKDEGPDSSPFPTLQQIEREHIEQALRRTGGKLHGPGGCAELLDMNPSTLRSRMRKLGLGGAREYRGA